MMLNNHVLQHTTLNGFMGHGLMNTDDIVFNNFGLQNDSIVIHRATYDDMPDIDISHFLFPQSHGGDIISRYFRDRSIIFQGTIKAENAGALVQVIDNFKKNLSKVKGNLDIKFDGTYRRILATLETLSIPKEHYHINYAHFTINFLCKEPFFYEIPYQENAFLAQSASFQTDITNYGTAEAYAKTTMIFNSAANVDNIQIDIESRVITVETVINTGDVLVFDGENKKVTLNDIEIDYTGVFEPLKENKNIFSISINGTFLVDVSVIYRKTFT